MKRFLNKSLFIIFGLLLIVSLNACKNETIINEPRASVAVNQPVESNQNNAVEKKVPKIPKPIQIKTSNTETIDNPIGVTKQSDSTGKSYHVDSTGKRLYPESYQWVSDFSNGRSAVCKALLSDCFHIDSYGKRIYPQSYKTVSRYSDGLSLVSQTATDGSSDVYFYIDLNGKRISNIDYSYAEFFENGRAWVKDRNGSSYYRIDTNEKYTSSESYSRPSSYVEGRAFDCSDTLKCFYIDLDGNKLFNTTYMTAGDYKGGKALVSTLNDQYKQIWFYIDLNGKKIEEMGEYQNDPE